MLVVLVILFGATLGCRISELSCRNGKCIPLDQYCNGNNDCGDNSDEPRYCTVCNRTYYGDVGRTYTMNIKTPRENALPYLCHLTFTANGNDNGDIVQLLFDSFTVGRYEDEGCPDGYMQVTELGRPLTEGGWCGESSGPTVYFSESTTITLTLRLIHIAPLKLNIRYKFLGDLEAITRMGSVEAPIERGVHVPGSSCSRTYDECYRKKCQVQSPNFPGLYPRNVTCYYHIKQKSVPTCKHAMISVKDNFIRIKRSVIAGLNKTVLFTRTDCNVHEDHLAFYDGATESDILLTRYCGGGLLPRVTARAPVMLVVFKSGSYAVPDGRPLQGFSFRVNVVYADSDSFDFASNPFKCEFLINGTTRRRGVVLSPRHSLAPNTTCLYKFIGLTNDRVWLFFESYSVLDNTNCTTRLKLFDHDTVLEDTCDVPRLCDHSSLRNSSRVTRPCKKQESYVTPSNRLYIDHWSSRGTVLQPVSFKFNYEFVDTRLGGENARGGGPCNRIFRKKKWGLVHSPKNVFMFGRGGATNLTCVYRIEAAVGERVRLSIHNASFGSHSCRTVADSHTSRPVCVRSGNAVELIVWDMPWQDVKLQRACYCDNSALSKASSAPATFLSSGRTLQVSFAVASFNVSEDFSQIYFHASYTITRWSECSRRQRVRGSGGEIGLVFPPKAKDDMYCEGLPWLVEANLNKSLFLLTWGHFMPLDAPSDTCHTTNRVLLYTGSPLRLTRVVCPSIEKEKEFAVHIFSEEWFGGSGVWSPTPPLFLVEFVGREAGVAFLNWLEISKSRTHSARQAENTSTWDCTHRCPELNACISPGLYCDGTVNCPSGFDEENPDCGVTTKLLSALTPGRVIVASTAGAALLACLCLVAMFAACRRPKSRHPKEASLLASNSSTLSS